MFQNARISIFVSAFITAETIMIIIMGADMTGWGRRSTGNCARD